MSRPVKKKVDNRVPPRQFRLDEEVIARLGRIAAHLTRTRGVKHSRADAIRVLSKEKDDAIRSEGGSRKDEG